MVCSGVGGVFLVIVVNFVDVVYVGGFVVGFFV